MGEAALEQALARLDGVPVDDPRAARRPAAPPGFEWAPAPLRPYLAGKSWRRVFGGFEEIRLGLHGDCASRLAAAARAGQRACRCIVTSADEYTIVLQGGFTDNTGNYGVGDFAVGPGPQEHEPIADPGEPCIALIVLEKPIVLTGFWGAAVQPTYCAAAGCNSGSVLP